jgi:hypothetical protein
MVNFNSPANQTVLAYMRRRQQKSLGDTILGMGRSKASPDALQHPANMEDAPILRRSEINTWRVGPHPDVVEYLWDDVTVNIPQECACYIGGTFCPLLVHPTTGVIFGFATGMTALLRLPEPELTQELAKSHSVSYQYQSETFYASELGTDWVILHPSLATHNQMLCKRAFEHAGTLP